MILVRRPKRPTGPPKPNRLRLFGNPDEVFLQAQPKQGLLTPAEVRSIALAELDIGPNEHRVGYRRRQRIGRDRSGAAWPATAQCIAIEMDPEDINLISANAERFGVKNLVPVLGRRRRPGAICRSPTAFSSAAAGVKSHGSSNWPSSN